jgi:hypothetical protein
VRSAAATAAIAAATAVSAFALRFNAREDRSISISARGSFLSRCRFFPRSVRFPLRSMLCRGTGKATRLRGTRLVSFPIAALSLSLSLSPSFSR